jgi:hypothetical protein
MKFMVVAKPKDTMTMLPPAVTRQLLEVSMAAMGQMKKAGKILEAYYSPVGCIVVMLNYNTAEEWVKDQISMPILTYYDNEIYPLADYEQSLKIFTEGLKAAEKMMPGAPR